MSFALVLKKTSWYRRRYSRPIRVKDESEDMKIEEAFRVKHEDTETQTKMCLLKRRVKT